VATWLFQHEQLSRDAAIQAEAVRVANSAIQSQETKLKQTLQESLKAYEQILDQAA
jgi:hypothetical protein